MATTIEDKLKGAIQEAIAESIGKPLFYMSDILFRVFQKYSQADNVQKTYWERNQLVAYLSKQYPAHLVKLPDGKTDPNLNTIVCIHSPEGILSWHIAGYDISNFPHLKFAKDDRDSIGISEKYNRLARLKKRRGF